MNKFLFFRILFEFLPDDIDQVGFDPNQTIAWNPNVTILNQLYLGQSNPKIN